MGWLTPTESAVAYGNNTPNFEQYVERTGLPALADVLVASLELPRRPPGRAGTGDLRRVGHPSQRLG